MTIKLIDKFHKLYVHYSVPAPMKL